MNSNRNIEELNLLKKDAELRIEGLRSKRDRTASLLEEVKKKDKKNGAETQLIRLLSYEDQDLEKVKDELDFIDEKIAHIKRSERKSKMTRKIFVFSLAAFMVLSFLLVLNISDPIETLHDASEPVLKQDSLLENLKNIFSGENMITGASIGISPVEETSCSQITICQNETVTTCVNETAQRCGQSCVDEVKEVCKEDCSPSCSIEEVNGIEREVCVNRCSSSCVNETIESCVGLEVCADVVEERCSPEIVESCVTEEICQEPKEAGSGEINVGIPEMDGGENIPKENVPTDEKESTSKENIKENETYPVFSPQAIGITAVCDEYLESCKSSEWVEGTNYCLLSSITGTVGTCMDIKNNSITLDCQGLTIDGDDTGTDYGILIDGPVDRYKNNLVKNCIITDFGGGIRLVDVNHSTISNNTLESNTINGIEGVNTGNITVINNTITGHTAASREGMLISSSNVDWNISFNNFTNNYDGIEIGVTNNLGISISDNRFVSNTDAGIYTDGDNATVNDNIFLNNARAVYLYSNSADNFFNNNQMNGSTTVAIQYYSVTNHHFYGNTVNGNPYVHCYNNNTFTSNNEFVNVDKITSLGSAIIYRCNNAVINNLTIGAERNAGYGLRIIESDNSTIDNSTFYNNTRGIYLDSTGTKIDNLTIKNNNFSANIVSGIHTLDARNITVFNNIFENHNGAGDEGMLISSGNVDWNISFNNFTNNYDGIEIGVTNNLGISISDNRFVSNTDAGIYTDGDNATVNNNIFLNNARAVYLYASSADNFFTNNQMNGSTTVAIQYYAVGWTNHHFYGDTVNGDPYVHCYNNNTFTSNNEFVNVDKITSLGSAIIYRCNNAVINNLTIGAERNTGYGLRIIESNDSIIDNSTFYNNTRGIYLDSTGTKIDNLTIKNNNFSANIVSGIYTLDARNITVFNNIFENHNGAGDEGMLISSGNVDWNISFNNFTNNYQGVEHMTTNNINFSYHRNRFISNSFEGISLSGDDNTFWENTFENNTESIDVETAATGNLFYRNNFKNSTTRHVEGGTSNMFNLSKTASNGGNWWDDFDTAGEGCTDADGDNFCDSPRNSTTDISFTGQDNHPYTAEISFVAAAGNTAPTHSTPILNTTNITTNATNTNLTAYNISTADVDNDLVKNIYNWQVNGSPITLINMPFESINGTSTLNAWDYSGLMNNGSDQGGIFWNTTGGYDGKGAYEFRVLSGGGSSQYIGITDNDSLDTKDQVSFEFWIKPRMIGGALYNRGAQAADTGYHWITIDADSINYEYPNGVSVVAVASDIVSWTTEQWYHIIITHNNATKTIKFYRDGANVGTTTYSDNALHVNSGAAYIGTYQGLGTNYAFNGTMDEVRMYNRSLSAEQVFNLYMNKTDEIVSNETNKNEYWNVTITPNDGSVDGAIAFSNTVKILNAVPTQGIPILNTTNPATNDTNTNLTAYNISTVDVDNDRVKNIYNWKINGTSITLLNMPFEGINDTTTGNAWDYSGYGNNGSDQGNSFWNSTGGYDGRGAYRFDGVNDYIEITDSDSLNFFNRSWTASLWVNQNAVGAYRLFIGKASNTAGQQNNFRLFGTSGNTLTLFWGPDTGGAYTASTGTIPTIGKWYHLIYGVDAEHKIIRYAINGVIENKSTATIKHVNNTLNLRIGTDTATNYDYNGHVDDVIFFNRSLSDAEILAIYNNRTDIIVSQETNTLEYWNVTITPNDGSKDGAPLFSNTVKIEDSESPTFTNALNGSESFKRYQNFTANITISNLQLDYYIFATNASGSWVNSTDVPISGATYTANSSANITVSGGSTVCWYYWANDTSANTAQSTTYCFTVNNSIPTHSTPILNTTNLATNDTNTNLTAYNVSTADADGDLVKNIYNWQVNGNTFALINTPFDGGSSGSFTKNYAGIINGTVVQTNGYPIWNQTGGHDGFGAYEFDGASTVSERIGMGTIADIPSINTTTLSIAVWYKLRKLSTTQNAFIRIGGGTNLLLLFGDERSIWHDGVSFNTITYNAPPAGVWVHQAITTNGTHAVYYYNGVANQTFADVDITPSRLTSTTNIDIGGHISSGADVLNGTLSELVLFNRTLSAEQISALYKNQTSIIVSQETNKGEYWNVTITPNDGTSDGSSLFSNTVRILNAVPTHSTPILNTTNITTNATNTNLTAYNVSTADVDGDLVKNIFNWQVNGTPIAVLNMPFEGINDTSTSNALDYSGYGNDGTQTGAVWNSTGGYDGKGAYEYRGIDTVDLQYIEIPDDDSLDFNSTSEEFTVTAWIKHRCPTCQGYDTALSKGLSGSCLENYAFLFSSTSGAIRFSVSNTTGCSATQAVTMLGGSLQADKWYHAAGRYNGTHLTLFINGVENRSAASTTVPMSNTGTLRLGWGHNTQLWNGSIDDVMIFNRSLSAEQISALYNNRTDLIVSQETKVGEYWNVTVTPNDGSVDGSILFSNTVEILNAAPTQGTPILNTTNPATNDTNTNLTAYNTSTADIDNNLVKNVFNWQVNGTSITNVNMPFEGINNTATNNAWDYSGFGNDGSDQGGIVWNSTGGYDGRGAYEFDAINDHISITDDNSLDTGDYASFEFWIKPKVIGGALYNRGAQSTSVGYHWITIDADSINYEYPNGASVIAVASDALSWTVNKWYHIIITHNNATKTIKFYRDGADAGTTTYSDNALHVNSGAAYIGTYQAQGTATYAFNGTMDEVRVYNRSLSPEQVWNLYMNRTDEIVSNETNVGNNWSVEITPNDGSDDGQVLESKGVLILPTAAANTAPTQGTPILNTTNLTTNSTNTNLTAYNVSTADADGNLVKNIFNWQVNGTPIAVLNMPFEGINNTASNNAWDYSGYMNNGSEVGSILWNSSGGYDGRGAYEFDGINDLISLGDKDNLDFRNGSFSISLWAKKNPIPTTGYMISKGCPSCGAQTGYSMEISTNNLIVRLDDEPEGGASIFVNTNVNPGTTWHHYAAVFDRDGDNDKLYAYFDGVLKASPSINAANGSVNNSVAFIIGALDLTGAGVFNGTIDEVMVFNRSLSPEQVWNLYMNRSDEIVSNETNKGEYWNVTITPNDGSVDGAPLFSNTVKILNSLPTAPALISPVNNTITTNRTLAFIWNNSVDLDNDAISYNLEIDDNLAFNNLEVNATSILNTTARNTTYAITTELAVDTVYYWRVKANDSSGYGAYSQVRNFTLQSYLSFSLPTSSVEFGSLGIGEYENTTDGSPPPFRGENTGNINFNVTINGTKYFTMADINTSNYLFKIRENETGAFNLSASITSYTNMTSISVIPAVVALKWQDINDDFLVDLNITVPTDEPPGVKSSIVTFTITG